MNHYFVFHSDQLSSSWLDSHTVTVGDNFECLKHRLRIKAGDIGKEVVSHFGNHLLHCAPLVSLKMLVSFLERVSNFVKENTKL
jgi:hypothetical protein